MAEVFQLEPNYGMQVSYEFNNKLNATYLNHDSVVAQWATPLASYSFGVAWFLQADDDYLTTFYNNVNGSQDTFLFKDQIDYRATKDPLQTSYGSATQGVLVMNNAGNWQLAKVYQLDYPTGNPTRNIDRIITRPDVATITVYNDLGIPAIVTIDPDTGEVNAGGVGWTWEGEFFVPVRLVGDTIPESILSYDSVNNVQAYQIPDLRFIEVREGDYQQKRELEAQYDLYYQLPFELGNAIDRTSATDIFRADSGYESRDTLNNYRRRVTLSEGLMGEEEKDYLVVFWRLMLGNFAAFKFQDAEANIDGFFRLRNLITFFTQSYDTRNNFGTYRANGLELIEETVFDRSFYCHIWKTTKTDGSVVAFTDHDQPIAFGGDDYRPDLGISSPAASNSSRLNTDSSQLYSAFNSPGINVAELLAGQHDNAPLEYSLFNWNTNTVVRRLFTGDLGGYKVGHLDTKAKEYKIQSFNRINRLDASAKIVTSSTCRVKFLSQGTGQCNRTIDASVRETGIVQLGSTTTDIILDISTANYRLGTLRFTSGVLEGREFFIGDVSTNTALLMYSTRVAPAENDTVEITRFCDKTTTACDGYANIINHRGFPMMMGQDQNIAKPDD